MSRFLDSTAPFKPINPWGRTPKPVRPVSNERVQLWSLMVDLKDGTSIRVGPRMQKKVVEDFLEIVNKSIIDGKEREWSNPRLVRH